MSVTSRNNNKSINIAGIVFKSNNGLRDFTIKNDVAPASVNALASNVIGIKQNGDASVGGIAITVGRGTKAYNLIDSIYKSFETSSVSEILNRRITATSSIITITGETYISEMTSAVAISRSDSTNKFEDNGAEDFLVEFTFAGFMPPEKRDIRISA